MPRSNHFGVARVHVHKQKLKQSDLSDSMTIHLWSLICVHNAGFRINQISSALEWRENCILVQLGFVVLQSTSTTYLRTIHAVQINNRPFIVTPSSAKVTARLYSCTEHVCYLHAYFHRANYHTCHGLFNDCLAYIPIPNLS